MPLNTGRRLGPYEIVAPLGAGGMGEVYEARDIRLGRTVAIKVLPESLARGPERRARFEREARTVSQLAHPHVCTLHDVGEEEGIHFLVLEHCEGETLAARLERGPLPLPEVLRHGAQIAEALDAVHRRGVVHRDLKPANVMLTRSGVKLLDFGLARLAAGDAPSGSDLPTMALGADHPLTDEGTVLGTYPYMAPDDSCMEELPQVRIEMRRNSASRRPSELAVQCRTASDSLAPLRQSHPLQRGSGRSVDQRQAGGRPQRLEIHPVTPDLPDRKIGSGRDDQSTRLHHPHHRNLGRRRAPAEPAPCRPPDRRHRSGDRARC